MNNQNYITLLHDLAVSNIHSSSYNTPSEYLTWFLKQVNNLFADEEKFIFTNIQYIPLKTIDNSFISHGRLKNIPTLINLEGFTKEKLEKLSLEVFSFLLASTFIEDRPFGNDLSLLNTYKDKFIIEVIKEKNTNQKRPVKFDEKNRLLSISVPEFFDENIAVKYFKNFLEGMEEGFYLKFDSRLIVDDKNFVDAFSKVMLSDTKGEYIEVINAFFNRTDIKEMVKDYKIIIDALNKKISVKMEENQLDQFVKMTFIHSWLKSTKYSYQITLAKFDRFNEPLSFGVFLITSENRITTNKLNLFHIALNIALNNISEFLALNSDTKTENTVIPYPGKLKSSKQNNNNGAQETLQFLYEDKKMRNIDFEISRYANLNVPVLITGETGVGKDLAAYLLYKRSTRADRQFIRIPIKNLTESLLESELFGYEKGAFTGATETKIGKLEGADSGTVYLPEISELSKNTQLKLLEFLQYQTISRVGGCANLDKKLNVRLIFASDENLEGLVADGKIRADFYYRIKVATIHIPPLRERKDDIVLLANYFLEKYSKQLLGKSYRFSDKTIELLKVYEWNGNVRELENSIIRAVIVSNNEVIEPDNFSELKTNNKHKSNNGYKTQDYKKAELEFKEEYFKNILEHANGNISKAAQIAGISRQNFYRILKELDL